MIDLLPVLVQATATTRLQLKQWFACYPAGMPWSVVSDYCIGDVNKENDVFSFVVIAPHDETENICEYIARCVFQSNPPHVPIQNSRQFQFKSATHSNPNQATRSSKNPPLRRVNMESV
jgi:hypothetical protein